MRVSGEGGGRKGKASRTKAEDTTLGEDFTPQDGKRAGKTIWRELVIKVKLKQTTQFENWRYRSG